MRKADGKNNNGMRAKPLVIVAVTALVLIGAAIGCWFGIRAIAHYEENALDIAQMEVTERNDQLAEQYAKELADYQQEVEARAGANAAWPTPTGEGWEIVDLTNYPLENAQTRTMTRQETMYGGMLLVNEWHSRPDDFSEDTLVSMYSYSRGQGNTLSLRNSSIRLFPEAAEAFYEMIMGAGEAGYEYKYYVIQNAYRSWDEQNELFQNALARHESRYSGDALIARAKQDVNYPGTSSYNSGTTAQIILYERNNTEVNNKVFFESPEGLWVYENSWQYGIVFRFPLSDYPVNGTLDKSYKTGVGTKLQTFNYVGKGNAAAMHILNLCMEEYVEYLMEHPHIAIFENGTLRYEISRQYVGDSDSFSVQMVGNGNVRDCSVCLDNMGYVIAVFEY